MSETASVSAETGRSVSVTVLVSAHAGRRSFGCRRNWQIRFRSTSNC